MSSADRLDVEHERSITDSVGEVVHLNHAGASPSPRPVLDTVVEHLRLEARIGGYEAADAAAERIAGVTSSVAALIGAEDDEVALLDGASRAWHLAFEALGVPDGSTVLASRTEYNANVFGLLRARDRRGVRLELLPEDGTGAVDPEGTAARLARGDVAAVSLSWVPSQGGLVHPAAAVGAACRAARVPFLLDACQAVGQMPVDVEEVGCDALAATGRKFLRGPRGTGFLYVRRSLLDRLDAAPFDANGTEWLDGDRLRPVPGARRFEPFERPVAAVLGLGAAVDHARAIGLDAIEARVTDLAERFRSDLGSVPGAVVRDEGVRRCGIVTFTLDGVASVDVRAALTAAGINVSVAPLELARTDLGGRGLDAVVRASVHYWNVHEELAAATEVVAGLAG
jgi:cysteine desulfurase / selenocysteine lyase